MNRAVFVEAKGRTGPRTAEVTEAAKAQASSVPSVLQANDALCVASISSFTSRGSWTAHLENASLPEESSEEVGIGELLVSYYRPLIAAMQRAGAYDGHNGYSTARLADIDVTLSVPEEIYSILRDSAHVTTQEAIGSMAGTAADLLGTVKLLHDSHFTAASPVQQPLLTDDFVTGYAGMDNIRVDLGDTWWPNLFRTKPTYP